jgi:hypothetical protein
VVGVVVLPARVERTTPRLRKRPAAAHDARADEYDAEGIR